VIGDGKREKKGTTMPLYTVVYTDKVLASDEKDAIARVAAELKKDPKLFAKFAEAGIRSGK
jgi:hypothetical protein